MVRVVPVTTARELRQFIMLPFRLYKGDPNWVAPLIGEQKKFFDPRHNPFFEHSEACLYLALKDNRVVGRISAHSNTRHNAHHNDNCGFFGFFECENDPEAATALLQTAWDWNRQKGRDVMRGPLNFTINDECAMLVDGFDTPPMLMLRHDKPYYQKLLEAAGYVKAMDMYAYLCEKREVPERIARLAGALEKRAGVTVRSFTHDKKKQMQDVEIIFGIYSKAWEHNWGNVPMTPAEYKRLADELLPLVDPDLIFIAEKDGVPIGFSLAMPNYNEVLKVMHGRVNPLTMLKALLAKRRISTARVVTMGVLEEYQQRGIDTVFYYYQFRNGIAKGIYRSEFSWVLENNVMMNRVAEMLDAKIYKTYRIYEKEITP